MSVRRVLYATTIDSEIKTQLRIVSFKKANNQGKKSKVYFVQFASQADAEAAARKCRRLGTMTLKEYEPHCTGNKSIVPKFQFTAEQLAILSQPPPPPPAERSTQPIVKVRHLSSQLAPNSTVVRSLLDSLQSCLTVIETAERSADRIRGAHSSAPNYDRLLQRLYHDHTTAFYVKATTLAQVKAANAACLRLAWDSINKCIQSLKDSVVFEQSFVTETACQNKIHQRMNFRESIVLTSQLACQVAKLIKV